MLAAFVVLLAGLLMAPSSADPAPRMAVQMSSFSAMRVVYLSVFATTEVVSGAMLHPFLASALPRGARVPFWQNVLGGLLASVIGYLPRFIWFGHAGMPGADRVGIILTAAAWVVPTAALLPHL